MRKGLTTKYSEIHEQVPQFRRVVGTDGQMDTDLRRTLNRRKRGERGDPTTIRAPLKNYPVFKGLRQPTAWKILSGIVQSAGKDQHQRGRFRHHGQGDRNRRLK